MPISRLALFLVLTVSSLITVSVACANEACAVERSKVIWKVPVIFVTDRQTHKHNYGPRRVLEKDTVSRVDAGIIEMFVQQGAKEELADWQHSGNSKLKEPTEAPTTTKFKCQSTADLNGDFDKAVRDSIKRTGKKEIFVFVHGFNNSFEDAAASAAKLGYYTGCPVILYSWPSVGKLTKYSLDECNNEWSQEHFNQFLEHLTALKKSEDIHFTITAHSMGNRLFVRSIPIIAGTGLFKDIYMVNPDFDAETFIHYLARYLPRKGIKSGLRAHLLISRKDKALSFSEAIFGGYTRLGQGVDFTLSALTSPGLFNNVWTLVTANQKPQQQGQQQEQEQAQKQQPEKQEQRQEKEELHKQNQQEPLHQQHPTGSAHDAKASEHGGTTIEADAAVVSALISSIDKSFKIFDVTALDRGFIGHKIPHEFIAWMHYRNQPPPGFEIEKGESKGLNRISSFFARGAKQNIAGGLLGDTYTVVKSPSPKK